jgi:hypothetical protein
MGSALVAERFGPGIEHPSTDAHGVLQLGDPIAGRRERIAEGPVFGLQPTGADQEAETVAGDQVQSGGHLRQESRRPERLAENLRADRDPRRRRSERRHHGPCLENAVFRPGKADQVIYRPHRVEPWVVSIGSRRSYRLLRAASEPLEVLMVTDRTLRQALGTPLIGTKPWLHPPSRTPTRQSVGRAFPT